jgi:hypothetical protein
MKFAMRSLSEVPKDSKKIPQTFVLILMHAVA